MNLSAWLLWGAVGTVVLTTLMAGSQSLGLTRMNLPYLLGTMFTPRRDQAKALGVLLHILVGLVLSLLYVAIFEWFGRATWWLGATIGLVHAAFVLLVGMPALPGIHPRMAGEERGPEAGRLLEPPGMLALHYGVRTPISVVLAHLAFGAILGAFYVVR